MPIVQLASRAGFTPEPSIYISNLIQKYSKIDYLDWIMPIFEEIIKFALKIWKDALINTRVRRLQWDNIQINLNDKEENSLLLLVNLEKLQDITVKWIKDNVKLHHI